MRAPGLPGIALLHVALAGCATTARTEVRLPPPVVTPADAPIVPIPERIAVHVEPMEPLLVFTSAIPLEVPLRDAFGTSPRRSPPGIRGRPPATRART